MAPNPPPKAGMQPVDVFMGTQATDPLLHQQAEYTPVGQAVQTNELITPGTGQVLGNIPNPATVATV